MINNEQLAEWKSQPTTQEIFKEIEGMISDLKEVLANGQTLMDSPGQTAIMTARTVGEISGLRQILGISYEDEEKE